MRLLGDSPDWDRLTFTLDDGPSHATRTAFTRLFDEGLIYRAERETLWCPGCATTLSDIEADESTGTPACSRCRTALEIRSTPQWYLRTSPLAAAATAAITSGATRIEPADAQRDYLRWADNLRRLVHLPAAVVGPPDPDLVRPRRGGARVRVRRADPCRVDPGPGHPGHVVLVGAVAALDPGVARRHP